MSDTSDCASPTRCPSSVWPEAIYGVECLTCGEESGLVDDDPKPVEVWALEHARHNGLSHGRFLVTTQKHWRFDPLHAVAARPPGVREFRGQQRL